MASDPAGAAGGTAGWAPGRAAGAQPQDVVSPLTGAAIFLVLVITPDAGSADAVRRLCADLSGLVRSVGFRVPDGRLTCVAGIGAEAWDRLAEMGRPAGLHPFREIRAGPRHALATPGDLLFHIRAAQLDLCFELASLIMTRLGRAATAVDEVHGFRYFDDRDLIGFVDGTENPVGSAAGEATLIGPEDPGFANGSYVIVQKYLHDVAGWNLLPVAEQERIIGRTKLSDVELDDSVKPSYAHNALTTIIENGRQVQIVRDNMAFGSVGSGEYGTYFIGYSRSPGTIEQMLVNMFAGAPEGNYDRLLDFSRAVTGTLFFVPSLTLLESLAEDGSGPAAPGSAAGGPTTAGPTTAGHAAPGPAAPGPAAPGPAGSGSLNIGSLRGSSQDE